MTRGLADTSIFIAAETGRVLDVDRLPDEVAVSIITIGELRAGVLAAADVDIRDRRLSTLMRALELQPIPVDQRVADAWARLRILGANQPYGTPEQVARSLVEYAAVGVSEIIAVMPAPYTTTIELLPINDSWIAATALALGVPIVTQDADYLELEGLDVIRI